jgi:hypothetical protein
MCSTTRSPRPGEYVDPQPCAVDVAGDESDPVEVLRAVFHNARLAQERPEHAAGYLALIRSAAWPYVQTP